MVENMAGKVTEAYLTSKELHVTRMTEDASVLRAGFAMKNREGLMVYMFFDELCNSIKFRSGDLAKIPEGKKEKMYKVCNDLNAKFRWIKFYVDEDDDTIMAEDDAVIQLDSCGQEALQCMIQLAHIADEAYPEIMKAIYG